MKTITSLATCAVLLIFTTQAGAQVTALMRSLDPSGSLNRLDEVEWSASGEYFDPAQTVVAGSRPRHVASFDVDASWQRPGDSEFEWTLNIHYPFPSTLNYEETMHSAGGGEIDGSDGFRPTVGSELPPARVGARAKYLAMSIPAIVLGNATFAIPVASQPNSFDFTALDTEWRVHLDILTGLPTRLSTAENDPLFGTVEATMHYLDWELVEGLSMPTQLEYRVDGQLIAQEFREDLDVSMLDNGRARKDAPPLSDQDYARGWNMAHFFLQRIALGGPADTDQSYPVDLLEVGEGIYQALGSSHHSLVVETADSLVIVDAPLYPSRSVAILEALADRWPDKPVSQVIVTHHHYDHSAGVAAFAAAGIPLTMQAGNTKFFTDALSRQGFGDVAITGIGDRGEFSTGGVTFSLYDLPTSHVAGMLLVYLPGQRLVFNSDLYSPGRATQQQLWASELQQAARSRGIVVDLYVGGHGRGSGTAGDLARVVEGD
jgi:glyoxylase-like metal-dependent hydrolase (beta-lactamase superfamily II)